MKRKSHLNNFSIESLFVILEQNQKELLKLQILALENKNRVLDDRIVQIKQTIAISENIVVERYLNSNISIKELIKLFYSATNEFEKNLYREIITSKIIKINELLSLDLLGKIINELEIDQLMRIIKSKEKTVYGQLALNAYNHKCLEVDDEVYKELLMKIKQDRRECY